ncbi:MAG: thiolase family protein [Gammaproteobacteria bacterium]|nr:thiolase family protein [Gammaproteobacteria bacterium]
MSVRATIPYKAYWSTPFARWQGAFAGLHSLRFAAHVARAELARRQLDPSVFDCGVLGMTRPERNSFYGLPWLAALIGAERVAGPTVGQACATSVRILSIAAREVADGVAQAALVVACDRTSNGPHIYYPNPGGTGGSGEAEDFVLENMQCDPNGGHSMLTTAENVAHRYGITTAQQHQLVLLREAQYRDALADSRRFQQGYMTLPFPVPDARFRKVQATLDGDEGVRFSTAEGLAALKPLVAGGTVTYGGQTHPADGNAAIVVASAGRARELSADSAVGIEIIGIGQARTERAYMPEAPIEAARRALENAGVGLRDLNAINTHNPFAVNDLAFGQVLGIDPAMMNARGCSLVFGHPNGPTGLRSTIELIEELVERGGGLGLFTGCAAGDSAMAVVVRVDRARR